MSFEPKAPSAATTAATTMRNDKGIRIFTYPKIIFMIPTLIVSIICGIGMLAVGDKGASAPPRATQELKAPRDADGATSSDPATLPAPHERFKAPENLLGVLFLGVLAFNLLIMAIDFPRFTIVAAFLLAGFLLFFSLWIGAYFDVDLMRSVRAVMAGIYVNANALFYFMVAGVLGIILAIVQVTRYLDYYVILPNEILHHHGPFSDLERFPTMNLKFDKEIPDILEFFFLGSGRLVLHVTEERKAIVLENVLFINSVENALKGLMSRLEVRVTTDKEVAEL